MFSSLMVAHIALAVTSAIVKGFDYKYDKLVSLLITCLGSTFLEACTDQNDNLFLPIYAYNLIKIFR